MIYRKQGVPGGQTVSVLNNISRGETESRGYFDWSGDTCGGYLEIVYGVHTDCNA